MASKNYPIGNGQNFKEGAWLLSTRWVSPGNPWLFDSLPWDVIFFSNILLEFISLLALFTTYRLKSSTSFFVGDAIL